MTRPVADTGVSELAAVIAQAFEESADTPQVSFDEHAARAVLGSGLVVPTEDLDAMRRTADDTWASYQQLHQDLLDLADEFDPIVPDAATRLRALLGSKPTP